MCAQKLLKCVVPENIHTCTPWKIATSSEGEGDLKSQNFRQTRVDFFSSITVAFSVKQNYQ